MRVRGMRKKRGNKEEGTSGAKIVHEESEDLNDSDYDLESESNNDKLYHENIDDEIECDDDLNNTKGSYDEKDRHKFCVFNVVELYNPSFELGMLFSTKIELRQTIHSHAIKTKKSINITKNNKIRVHAKCADKECGWKFHALKLIGECKFQISKYNPNHSCELFGKYIQKFKSDHKRNVKGFRIDVMEGIRCHISNYQAYRAKKNSVERIEGSLEEQYSLLWDYGDGIKRTNPGTTVITRIEHPSGDNRFERFYICLHALKIGFFASCRPFIGNLEYTFTSDKQKSLIQAFEEVFSNSDNRFCVRNMHPNFKNDGFRGQAFKSALWNGARASTVNELRRRIKKIRDLDESADECRSHFTDYCRCDMLLNNGCESFNNNILDARDKLIVSICE
ncbi:hypothetical protein Pfo_026530 [Paulownia fortunei]|nr:hypothetical protein Pfo_026530 [Paulownia fortunei]